MIREIHNYYARTRDGNLQIFGAARRALADLPSPSSVVAGPFEDRAATVIGLYVSGRPAELSVFRANMARELTEGRDFWVGLVVRQDL